MRNGNASVEDNSLMITRERFIDICLDNVRAKYPNVVIEQKQDDFHYNIEFDKDTSMLIYLGNAWENYQRTKNPNVIVQFIDSQLEIFMFMDDSKKHGVNPDMVFPVFRTKDFDVSAGKEGEKDTGTLRDTFSSALDILYVQDHPRFVSFVTEKQMPDGYTADSLAEKAFDNLKKQGWIEPIEKFDISDIATVYLFHECDKQYQAQFMVKEMYTSHLGDYFYVAMPTRDDAMVVAWHVNPDDHIDEGLELAQTLKMQAIRMFHTEQNPLTPIIHRISNGDVRVLG